MKITKRQLKRIIREEKERILNEAGYRDPKTGEDLFLKLNGILILVVNVVWSRKSNQRLDQRSISNTKNS